MYERPVAIERGGCVCVREYTVTNHSDIYGEPNDTMTVPTGERYKYTKYSDGDVFVFDAVVGMLISSDDFDSHFEKSEQEG